MLRIQSPSGAMSSLRGVQFTVPTLLTQVTNPLDQVPTLLPTGIWPTGSGGSWNRKSEQRIAHSGEDRYLAARLRWQCTRASRNNRDAPPTTGVTTTERT